VLTRLRRMPVSAKRDLRILTLNPRPADISSLHMWQANNKNAKNKGLNDFVAKDFDFVWCSWRGPRRIGRPHWDRGENPQTHLNC
jgi:hypothetical protein